MNLRQRPSGFGLAPYLGALIPVFWMVAGDEILQILIGHGILLQREMNVGTEIINPHGLCLRFRTGGTLVKEDDTCLDTCIVENAGGQTENGMEVCGPEQFLADDFTGAAFKQDIIRNDNSGLAGSFQNGVDVLHEIELLVAAGGPGILPIIYEVLFLMFAFLIGKGEGGFLPKGGYVIT